MLTACVSWVDPDREADHRGRHAELRLAVRRNVRVGHGAGMLGQALGAAEAIARSIRYAASALRLESFWPPMVGALGRCCPRSAGRPTLARAPYGGQGFPGSHGPPEQEVDEESLTGGYRGPLEAGLIKFLA
jgi:hypothetical protein